MAIYKKLGEGTNWKATMELRWYDTSYWHTSKPYLQQKWVSEEGKIDWRTVPTTIEEMISDV